MTSHLLFSCRCGIRSNWGGGSSDGGSWRSLHQLPVRSNFVDFSWLRFRHRWSPLLAGHCCSSVTSPSFTNLSPSCSTSVLLRTLFFFVAGTSWHFGVVLREVTPNLKTSQVKTRLITTPNQDQKTSKKRDLHEIYICLTSDHELLLCVYFCG